MAFDRSKSFNVRNGFGEFAVRRLWDKLVHWMQGEHTEMTVTASYIGCRGKLPRTASELTKALIRPAQLVSDFGENRLPIE